MRNPSLTPGRRHAGPVLAGAVLAASACHPPDRPCGDGRVCVVVGSGSAGFNGDGKPAIETDLYLPTAVFRHPDGRLVLVDENNYRVRALEPDGTVTTLAGAGIHAYAHEGAPALETPFENAFDGIYGPDGALYLVAAHEGRVLRIGEAGVVEVVAGTGEISWTGDGGDARLATFVEPKSLAFDDEGALYVADSGAHVVRRIAPDGVVTRAVGTGDAGPPADGLAEEVALFQPEGISWDAPRRRLLIADSQDHRICAFEPASGFVTTLAGTGTAGYSGDGGPATAAALDFPRDAVAAEDGTVYVADTGNAVVRAVAPDGDIATVLGTGSPAPFPTGSTSPVDAPLGYPLSLTLEPGALYVSDWFHQRVLVWALDEEDRGEGDP